MQIATDTRMITFVHNGPGGLGDHAFNENLPTISSLTWQIAGDMLPQATKRTNPGNRFLP